jgi:hypothetical protein
VNARLKAPAAAAAARRLAQDVPIPLTLGEACELIGRDLDPENFASSALESIADQIEITSVLVETDSSGESWRLFANLAERAKFASRIAKLLQADSVAESEASE